MMSQNELGNFIRNRRKQLGLTQQQLASRTGGNTTQADISRMEGGSVTLPRRGRLEALAAALEVTPGALFMHSGWLAQGETDAIDGLLTVQQLKQTSNIDGLLQELVQLRESLLSAIDRVTALEEQVREGAYAPAGRGSVAVHTGIFDAWEKSEILVS